jgi:hypothetical protein
MSDTVHDPLCHIAEMRSRYADDEVSDATLRLFAERGLCDCNLIARVREDERSATGVKASCCEGEPQCEK